MKINEYVDICKKFSNESKQWAELDKYNYYTTDGNFDWKESSDNSCGGLDVSWAFGLPEEKIEKDAPQFFVDEIEKMLAQAIDEEWDFHQIDMIRQHIE